MRTQYRRKRRSRNNFGSAVADSAEIANRLSPRGAFIVGAPGFVLFYFIVPWLLVVWADHNKAKMTGDLAAMWAKVIDDVFLRRFIHPSEWTGIAILIVCTFIGLWKFATRRELSRRDANGASIFSRLISRLLD